MPTYKVFIPIYNQIIEAEDQSHALQIFDETCDSREWIDDRDNVVAEELPDIGNADHPSRKAAIAVIERVIEPLLKKGIQGEKYYQLEDALTEIIVQYK